MARAIVRIGGHVYGGVDGGDRTRGILGERGMARHNHNLIGGEGIVGAIIHADGRTHGRADRGGRAQCILGERNGGTCFLIHVTRPLY